MHVGVVICSPDRLVPLNDWLTRTVYSGFTEVVAMNQCSGGNSQLLGSFEVQNASVFPDGKEDRAGQHIHHTSVMIPDRLKWSPAVE